MVARKPYLSKSRLISAWQCARKLHLEKHHPELGEISSQTESLFATGNQVGDIAQQLYGTEKSVEVAFNFKTMLAETRRLIDGGADFPIFEATFRYENVLIRADVLIPDGQGEDKGWHVIEVKASTSLKDYHVLDCAIQDWVLRNSGINVLSISLAHINNQFVYAGDENYDGLLIENDLTTEVRSMEYTVLELVAKARDAVTGPMPLINVGAQCNKPYECQFQSHCWPGDTEYPIVGLGGSRAKLGNFVAAGAHDIRDVSADELTAETQQRIHRVTLSGKPEVLPGAKGELESLAYPRYYLDFETIGPAVPIWAANRPYAAIPIQWSCHIEEAGGEIRHEEFLDLSGEPPMRALAEKMIECLGDSGPVLMYTSYEKGVINGLIKMFPDLEEPLQAIVDRLFDLHPVVKAHYYHPKMMGSWSIKAVLPCIAPHMNYSQLEGIHEGTGASDGFLEAIGSRAGRARTGGDGSRPGHPHGHKAAPTGERKAELEEQLLRYCRFDTEAMVEIVRFFTSQLN